MSTVAIYNGFGQYETNNDGQRGITLTHGGVPFWLPFEKTTYIPDYTMREVDHNASSSDGEAESMLVYKTFRLSGERIAEELLETQIPTPNKDKGIVMITGKKKDSFTAVPAGVSEDGQRLSTEVQEIEPDANLIAEARQRAIQFKEETIQLYFQSKRERMAGGHGQIFPKGLTKIFMTELGVKDIDDVSRHTGTTGLQELADLLRRPPQEPIAIPSTATPPISKHNVAADLV